MRPLFREKDSPTIFRDKRRGQSQFMSKNVHLCSGLAGDQDKRHLKLLAEIQGRFGLFPLIGVVIKQGTI
jgi:hypothetical protein